MCARHVTSVHGREESRRSACCCGWTGDEHLGPDAGARALADAVAHTQQHLRARRRVAPLQVRALRDAAALIDQCARMDADLHDVDGQPLGRLTPRLAEVLTKSMSSAADLIGKYGDAALLPVQIDLDLAALVVGAPQTEESTDA